jgi:hypothetical protein
MYFKILKTYQDIIYPDTPLVSVMWSGRYVIEKRKHVVLINKLDFNVFTQARLYPSMSDTFDSLGVALV